MKVPRAHFVWAQLGIYSISENAQYSRKNTFFNPRPAGVWIVTRPAGGGGGPKAPPPEISQTTGPISKFQTPFDSPVRELPVQGQTFDPRVTDDVTGQVSQNFRLFGLGDIGE